MVGFLCFVVVLLVRKSRGDLCSSAVIVATIESRDLRPPLFWFVAALLVSCRDALRVWWCRGIECGVSSSVVGVCGWSAIPFWGALVRDGGVTSFGRFLGGRPRFRFTGCSSFVVVATVIVVETDDASAGALSGVVSLLLVIVVVVTGGDMDRFRGGRPGPRFGGGGGIDVESSSCCCSHEMDAVLEDDRCSSVVSLSLESL